MVKGAIKGSQRGTWPRAAHNGVARHFDKSRGAATETEERYDERKEMVGLMGRK